MATSVETIHTIDEAIELAGEIERAEAALKQMKDQLKAFVDENGSVETSDKVWDYNVSVSWKFDGESLKRMSQDMALDGLNPWEMLSLPSSSLKKLGWSEDVLSQYGTKKETRRFASRKKISYKKNNTFRRKKRPLRSLLPDRKKCF